MPQPLDYGGLKTDEPKAHRPWGCLTPGLLLSASSIPVALLKIDPDVYLPFVLLWGGLIVLGLGIGAVVFARARAK